MNVAKTKVLVSCAVAAQLICVFVFTYAKNMFSHGGIQINLALTDGCTQMHGWFICGFEKPKIITFFHAQLE